MAHIEILEILLGRPEIDLNVRHANELTPMDLGAESNPQGVVQMFQ
ncbi:protein of unknown function [Cardinium endosymbiont cEper1 of Encarsia pergandiella]|nr:hypothetical protein [Cardinium endosymbiont of Encarsia pergandiella]CCM10269.1 protein of unknown function [Cardinium endosymbiont cEper1 of Encarsia pergandiella]